MSQSSPVKRAKYKGFRQASDPDIYARDLDNDLDQLYAKFTDTIQLNKLIVGSTDSYTKIDGSGILTMSGSGRVFKHLIVSAAGFGSGAGAPDTGTQGTFATLLYASTGTEIAYYNLHLPEDWAAGTDITMKVYWAPTTGAAGGVAWEIDWEAVATEANEVLGAGSTHIDIHDATQSLAWEALETPVGTIAGASIGTDDVIGICISRDHDDVIDNYGADAALIHLEIEYLSDKLGEAS